jgi:hypothetical protein
MLVTNFPSRKIGSEVDYEAIKRSAFHDQGIAIIDLTDRRIPWDTREIIEGACGKLCGQKRSQSCAQR